MIIVPKIAIIDTGIGNIPTWAKDVIEKKDLYFQDKKVMLSDGGIDKIGHGTLVAECIKKYCPDTQLYVINIFKETAITSSVLLYYALRMLVSVDLDIVNISLNVDGDNNELLIDGVLEKLKKQGKIVVVSDNNKKETGFPARSDNCIGVGGNDGIPLGSIYFDQYESIQVATSNEPEIFRNIDGEYQGFGGNSKAAAYITGTIAKEMVVRGIGSPKERINTVYSGEIFR